MLAFALHEETTSNADAQELARHVLLALAAL